MKALKIIFGIVAALAIAILVIAAVLPSEYHVERSIEINKPASEIFPHVVDLHNWDAWSPYRAADLEAKYEYSGNGVGSKMSWEGEVVGVGSLTIKEITPHKEMKTHLKFVDPQMTESDGTWTFEESANGTRVTWANDGKLGYPMGRVFGLFLDGMIGTEFQKGLNNLKKTVE
ncbi:SRPBCC family protein [Flammeovirgaceae bacterium SG7u.111]|nr:SRPBCC family protein [Flammeovirgaceae bacterium SG7u.132]WPO36449.1 SRPBCC family protein [Flammeovirgaceae bacterium SG7u.111]